MPEIFICHSFLSFMIKYITFWNLNFPQFFVTVHVIRGRWREIQSFVLEFKDQLILSELLNY